MLQILWILIPIVIGVGIFLAYWFQVKNSNEEQGWDCVEGDCEKVLGGEFKSYEQCRNRCADNKGKEGYGSCSSNGNDGQNNDISQVTETKEKKVRFQDDESNGETRIAPPQLVFDQMHDN